MTSATLPDATLYANDRGRSWRTVAQHVLREHALPLLVYAALTIALSWPTAQHFTSSLTGSGDDVRHNLWILWHTQQALLGKEPLFQTSLLYYPVGISLFIHALGPLEGVFALPFWSSGPAAAYNGALLIGFWLTGYCMYLLARTLGLARNVALFAGVLLMSSAMPLVGLYGHLEKTFLGLLPLALLCAQHALNLKRSRWWVIATVVVLQATLLHTGWQFVLAVMAIGYFACVAALRTEPTQRPHLLRRMVLFAFSALALLGPLLAAIALAASNPALDVNSSFQSFTYQPDLIEFFLPARTSRWLGMWSMDFLRALNLTGSIETSVSLHWSGIALCLLALFGRYKPIRRWLLLLLISMTCALGPDLKVLGHDQLSANHLSLPLPYAFLTLLPPLQFMRTPGHFMMMGNVAFAVAAAYGLAWLAQHRPRWQWLFAVLAIMLTLAESWPREWPQQSLRPVPQFYRQITNDGEMYGVFDLPIMSAPDRWAVSYSSLYQMDQMTHHKGIAAGYLSRTYKQHPLFPCFFTYQPDVLVNHTPVSCYPSEQNELARQGYRYVVWHKPQANDADNLPDSWGDTVTRAYLQAAFAQQKPLVDDEALTVYTVAPLSQAIPLSTTMILGSNWHGFEGGARWAASPATLAVTSPYTQNVVLQLTMVAVYDPKVQGGVGNSGTLRVESSGGFTSTVAIAAEQTTSVPLLLSPGSQTLTLNLSTGNFRPTDYGAHDGRLLSFAIRSINLQTLPDASSTISTTKTIVFTAAATSASPFSIPIKGE